MKRTLLTSSVLAFFLSLSLTGCKSSDPTTVNATKPSPANSNAGNSENSNRSQQPVNANVNADGKRDERSAQTKSNEPPQLLGNYEAREIEDKGIVTLVSKIRTVISFAANGTYTRVSQHSGQTYHTDSGQFRVEAPNKLVLSIQMSSEKSRPKIQNPPLQRTYIFNLSPDGDELKLTPEKKGSTGVFRRVAKPNAS
jgi:hypothetical protein